MANVTKIKASDKKPKETTEVDDKAKKSKKKAATASDHAETKAVAQTKKEKSNKKPAKTEDKKLDKKASKQAKKQAKKAAKAKKPARRIPVISYIKESFQEIRQVRWPNRKETWKMTLSVILYVVLIAGFIMLLDAGLTVLFNKILMLGN